jgi:ribosomal protein L6P/L9E
MKYPIPYSLTIICKKKKIYLFSVSKQIIFNFLRQLKYYKLPNRYKGKGLLEFKQFRGFIMLKKGKKQN